MKDFKGQELIIGDIIVFTMGKSMLRESKIIEINDDMEEKYSRYHNLKVSGIKRTFLSTQVLKIK